MQIIKESITVDELERMSKNMHGNLVKVMVDIEKQIMAVDAPLHSDLMELLIQEESCEPNNLWGINLYPAKQGTDFIEFDSMMNLKPALGNMTRGVEDGGIREKIVQIITGLVQRHAT